MNSNHRINPEFLSRLRELLEDLLPQVHAGDVSVSQGMKRVRQAVLAAELRFTGKIHDMTLNELRQQQRALGTAGVAMRAGRMVECMTRHWGDAGTAETKESKEPNHEEVTLVCN